MDLGKFCACILLVGLLYSSADAQIPTYPPVYGNGTTNFLPKWSSASRYGNPTLGNSSIVEIDGNVGIGIIPSSTLTVGGIIHSASGGFKFPDGTIQTSGRVVSSLNNLWGNITLAAGQNISIAAANNTVTISANLPATTNWSLYGNAGTTPAANFLGTTDKQPFEVRVNNIRAFRLEPSPQSGYAANVIGGSSKNSIAEGIFGATISGGGLDEFPNRIFSEFGTIGGGWYNLVWGSTATVGGGNNNQAIRNSSTVGGGQGNRATESYATVGGGVENVADHYAATVSGGQSNTASHSLSTVIGGEHNIASGFAATVAGGQNNTAASSYSFAGGRKAKINVDHAGTFLFSDASNFDFSSLAANEFAARATGGVRFVTSIDINGAPVAGVALAPGSSSWSVLSDRAAKANYSMVDGQAILLRLATLPIQTWNYTSQNASIRHIGPMAQDFAAAFRLGEDDRHISTVDADGIALAAIQGLYQLNVDKEKKIEQLTQNVTTLRQDNADLQKRLAALEEIVKKLTNNHQ